MLGAIQRALLIPPEKRNVGTSERFISSFAGMMLCTMGFRSFKKGGCVLLPPAAYLLYRGASGYCPINERIDRDTTEGANEFLFDYRITIRKPVEEVYAYWRQLENLAVVMSHIEKIEKVNDTDYRWTALFNDQEFTWQSRITEDKPNRILAWKSADPSDIYNEGMIRFRGMNEGKWTSMDMGIIYRPAKTKVGELAAWLFTPVFERIVKKDLRRFKHLIEGRDRVHRHQG